MEFKSKRAQSLSLDSICERLEIYVNKRFARAYKREFQSKFTFFRNQQISDLMDFFFIFNNYDVPKSIILDIFQIQPVQLDRDLSLCNSPEALIGKKNI